MPVISLLVVGSFILGATSLEDFALALLAGLFIGTYSSIYVATPLLVWMKEREPQYRAIKLRRARQEAAEAVSQPVAPALARVGAGSAAANGSDASDASDASDGSDHFGAGDEPPPRERGVPGPPAVPRQPVAPRPRQQRGRKRR
jgi:preprotein translocase subunit SecF